MTGRAQRSGWKRWAWTTTLIALLVPAPAAAQVTTTPDTPTVRCAKASPGQLRITGIEVTQGAQTIAGGSSTLPAINTATRKATYAGVRLVKHASTVVRVFADVNGSGCLPNVGATLTVKAKGQAPVILWSDEVLKDLRSGPAGVSLHERGDSSAGYTFELPGSFVEGDITLQADLVPNAVDPACPHCPASATMKLPKFVNTGTLKFSAAEMLNLPSESGGLAIKPDETFASAENMMPLGDGDLHFNRHHYAFRVDSTRIANAATIGDLYDNCLLAEIFIDAFGGTFSCSDPPGLNDQVDAALAQLKETSQYQAQASCRATKPLVQCDDITIGVNDSWHGGIAGPGLPLFTGTQPADVVRSDGPQDAAHEVGHSIGRMHASGGCGASNPEAWPPDEEGRLDSVGLNRQAGSGAAYGGPYRAITSGQDSLIGRPSDPAAAFYNPKLWYDVMSYCTPGAGARETGPDQAYWISAKGWDEEVTSLASFPRAQARAATPIGKVEPGLHVSGWMNAGGHFFVSAVRPGSFAVVGAPTGVAAVVHAKNGAVLAQAPLLVTETHVDNSASPTSAVTFVEGQVPLAGVAANGGLVPPAVGDLRIQRDDGTLLSGRKRSANPPTVTLTSPAAKANVGAGAPLDVRWTSADPDGDPLTAAVVISSDAGKSFRPLYAGPDHGAVSVPRDELTGSDHAIVRVRVSDSFDQARALSGEITVAGHAPDVSITRPLDGTRIVHGTALAVAGIAADDRDVALGGRSLRWLVDGKPTGATGPRVALRRMRPGTHRIRLDADDHTGRTGSDEIKVVVRRAAPVLQLTGVPARLRRGARVLTLKLAANVPARVHIGGTGITAQTIAAGPRPRTVHVAVTSHSALRLLFTARADGRRSRMTAGVLR
jgi:hypothetical protein